MASGSIVTERPTIGFGFETLTVSDSATPFSVGTYAPSGEGKAEKAFVTVDTGEIRYRYDGTNPDSSSGHIASTGTSLLLKGDHQVKNFRAVRNGNENATLSVTYERE